MRAFVRGFGRSALCFVLGTSGASALAADLPAPRPVETASGPPSILNAQAVPIDLGAALRLAGVENPELLLARQRVVEATAIQQFAAAQALPSINVGTNYDLHRGPLQQSSGNILQVHRDALYAGLGANAVGAGMVNIPGLYYNLNVGAAVFGYLQSRQIVAAAQAANRAVNNDVLLRVCEAYMNLLRAEGRRAVAAQNVAEAAEAVRLTDAYVKAGQGRKADADRAATESNQRLALLSEIEGEVLAVSARLCRLLNLDPSVRLTSLEGWVVPAPVVPDPIPVQELIAIALMQRPELAERRAEIQRAVYELSSAKLLPFSPNAIVGFSTGTFGGGSNLVADRIPQPSGAIVGGPRFGDFNGRTDFDVVLFWTAQNLGLGNLAQVRAAGARVQMSNFRQLETLNRVRAEVATAYAMTHARFNQIDSGEKAVRAGTEAFRGDLIRIRGREGLPIEMLNSMRLLARARYDYLDAIVNYNIAHFRLYVALGTPPADRLARPVPGNLVAPPGSPPNPPVTDSPPKEVPPAKKD